MKDLRKQLPKPHDRRHHETRQDLAGMRAEPLMTM